MLEARSWATPTAQCVIDHEIGGTGYDPTARGQQGERGPAQLHPHGLLPHYLRWSEGADPENPYLSITYLDLMIEQGMGHHWSPIRLGLC